MGTQPHLTFAVKKVHLNMITLIVTTGFDDMISAAAIINHNMLNTAKVNEFYLIFN